MSACLSAVCFSMRILLMLTAFVLAACSAMPLTAPPTAAELQQVLSVSPFGAGKVEAGRDNGLTLPDDQVMALNDYMRHFLKIHIPADGSKKEQLNALINALMAPDKLGFSYDPYGSYSAADTFLRREGNCLSFATLFVAMASELGLDVYFNEVDIPPTWDMPSASTYVYYKHINVIAQFRGYQQIVDLNVSRYSTRHQQRGISAEQAQAHYYSNRAMSFLFFHDQNNALRYMLKAIDLAPDVGYLWANLAAVYRRQNLLAEAEVANRQALFLEPDNLMAISNLGLIYDQLERPALATQFNDLARQYRLQNPFFRYNEARLALARGDHTLALEHIKKAIEGDPAEHRFYYLAAQIYDAMGLPEKHRKYLQRALKAAPDADARQQYQSALLLTSR